MKKMIFVFLTLFLSAPASFAAATNAEKKYAERKYAERGQIGSTFTSPVLYQNQLYFVATTGVLYQSNTDLTHTIKLFEGKKQALSGLTLIGSTLYWGEGAHDDTTTTLHAFDLHAKKMIKEISIEGHIERSLFVHNDILYVGMGAGGIGAFKKETLEKIWITKEINGKAIHADGNIVFVENKLCTTSIYGYKAIVCLDPKSGKITNHYELKKSPKSEITSSESLLIGFATEANFTEAKWTTPADFYVIDIKKDKIQVLKELRGYNFFAPVIYNNAAFVTLSTGDFITISLANGNIGFMGEFSEPFINNTFMMKEQFCALGIMGKLLCYSKNKSSYALSQDKRLLETPIGKISNLNGIIYAPSRIGYFIIE